MAIPVVDQSEPLVMDHVEVRTDSTGRREAFCPGCGGWLVLDNYMAQRLVFRQIIHRLPCQTVDAVLKDSMEKGRHQKPDFWTNIEELFKCTL